MKECEYCKKVNEIKAKGEDYERAYRDIVCGSCVSAGVDFI